MKTFLAVLGIVYFGEYVRCWLLNVFWQHRYHGSIDFLHSIDVALEHTFSSMWQDHLSMLLTVLLIVLFYAIRRK